MMQPLLKFLPGKMRVKGKCIYRASDMTLEYEVDFAQSVSSDLLANVINQKMRLDAPAEFLLIADTLTLTFSGSDYYLSGFDAYTNKQLWRVSSLHRVPKISGQGSLVIEPPSFAVDRYSFSLMPKYEIAESQQWVRAIFSELDSNAYYEVANNLLVGMKSEMITDIYLLDVAFL